MQTGTITLFLFASIGFASFSQDKSPDYQASDQRITQLDVSIDSIDVIIDRINYRASVSELSESDQLIIDDRLRQLNAEKQKLENIKYSINANLQQPQPAEGQIIVIDREEFNTYSDRRRQEILAHPERYRISD